MKTILESNNIKFVQLDISLVDDYLLLINDFEHVGKYIGNDHGYFDKEKEIAWINEKLAEKAHVYSMIEKKSNKFIGNIEFMHVNEGSGELGIALTYSMQEKGYGTEAIKAFTKYGKDILNLKHIVLRTNVNNFRAQHVYNKCGFKEYKRDEERIYMEQI